MVRLNKILLAIAISLLCSTLVSAISTSFTDQGTNVKYNNATISSANLTITIWSDPTSTSQSDLVYNNTFIDAIVNGVWNVQINTTNLEFGRQYYKDYDIDSNDIDFDGNERIGFYSTLGILNNQSLVNTTAISGWSTNTTHTSTGQFVGIGRNNPRSTLDVNGTGNFSVTVWINGSQACTAANGLCAGGSGNTSSTGTAGYISMFQSNTLLNNSVIYQNGSNIGIGRTSPNAKLTIDSTTSNQTPLIIRTNGSIGNYYPNNSGIFIYDAAGVETLRIVATDPDPSGINYNTWNLYIGKEAGNDQPADNTNAGYGNTGVGYKNLNNITTGIYNTGFGAHALSGVTVGNANTAVGTFSLSVNKIGDYNTALGIYSNWQNLGGNNSVTVGAYSLYSNTQGNDNTALGYESLYYNNGNRNTAIGSEVGRNPLNEIAQYRITTDSDMVLVGRGATKDNTSILTNGIAIGSGARVLRSNQVVLGNSSISETLLRGFVGIATNSPQNTLDVNGSMNVSENITINGVGYIGNSQICTAANGLCPANNITGMSELFLAAGDTSGVQSITNGTIINFTGGIGVTVTRSSSTLQINYTTAYQTNAAGWSNITDTTNTDLNVNLTSGNLTVINGYIGAGTPTPARVLHVNNVMRLEPVSAAPLLPSAGDIYFDSDLNMPCYYNSTDWVTFDGSSTCS